MEAFVEWSAATAVLPGEQECGDRHLVHATPTGVLVAAVDGLGHGREAAAAASAAIETLERNAHEPILSLLQRCHESLRTTRGAVMSLAAFNELDRSMTWAGVGNVEGVVLRAKPGLGKETLLLRGGVVGAQLPALQTAVIGVSAGDVLVFATDGIGPDFACSLDMEGSLQASAERVLARYGKGTDDALVLIARVRS
jgi:phosphoserine phosphatase RsbX